MANVAFAPPLEQPYPSPDRLVGVGTSVYPTEPTVWSTPPAFVPSMAGWYQETARPVWKVKPRPHGGCWLGAVQDVASAAEFDWHREVSVPTRRKPQTRTGLVAFGGNPDLTGSLDFPKWCQPLERPRNPVKPRLQGWFGFGGDADAQEYGVIDWYVPVTQPPRWDRLGSRLGRPDPSRQGFVIAPVEPTQIVPTQALTGWYREVVQPTRRSARRTEGGTFSPLEPSQTGGLGWFIPASPPIRKVPQRHPGFFVLTMNPDLLGVPYVESWQPQTLPPRSNHERLRRPERLPAAFAPLEPTQTEGLGWFVPASIPTRKIAPRHPGFFVLTTDPDLLVGVPYFEAWQPQTLPPRADDARLRRRPERLPAAFAPLEPTQVAVGSVDQWFRPLAEPPRPKRGTQHASYTLVADVTWFNLPAVSAWYVPLAEPVRTVPPHPLVGTAYQPPPALWATGTIVATPYYTLAADFYQPGAVAGDQKRV